MKKIILVLVNVILVTSFSYSQKTFINMKEVYDATHITFYGYDYSGFQLNDQNRIGEDIQKDVLIWIDFCQEKLNEKKLAQLLKMDVVTFNFKPTIELAKNLNSGDLIGRDEHTIRQDAIPSFVKKYSLSETDGIGFVVIVENFDIKSKTVSAYYTFFDIRTQKVINTFYDASRSSNGYNHILDWGDGLIIGVKKYAEIFRDKQY